MILLRDNDYIVRINQAIDYIHANIDKNLTVEDIASRCCFSKFYFNRVFRSVVNESVYSFIKRLKLEQAAFKLRKVPSKPITDIGLEIGYSPSNFATAFKDYFSVSPSEFRKDFSITIRDSYLSVQEYIKNMRKNEDLYCRVNEKIRIKRLPRMTLFYVRHIGNYKNLTRVWEELCEKAAKLYAIDENSRYFGISYDDPLITDENRCIYDACIEVPGGEGPNILNINEGKYAVYEFKDNIENLINAFNEILSIWLPFSGYDLDSRYALEHYLTAPDDNGNVHAELYIPIV